MNYIRKCKSALERKGVRKKGVLRMDKEVAGRRTVWCTASARIFETSCSYIPACIISA